MKGKGYNVVSPKKIDFFVAKLFGRTLKPILIIDPYYKAKLARYKGG